MNHTSRWPARCCAVFAAALVLAWLVPDHYPPWPAFHSDWLAAAGLLAAATLSTFAHGVPLRVPVAAICVAGVALVPLIQWLSGMIFFAGDAIMATTYLLGFALSLQLGYQARVQTLGRDASASPLMWAALLGGVACVGLAFSQWLSLDGWLGSVAIPLLRAQRPAANFAQPNQLATFLVWAFAAALWMHERSRLGSGTLLLISAVLAAGIALTQSRTGSVELLLLLVVVTAIRRRVKLRVGLWNLLAAATFFLLFAGMLPWLANALLIASPVRPVSDLAAPGLRPIHWATVSDAISRAPWTGYGWNQLSVAVARVAAEHPPTHEMIEHSHNLVLDLLAWNGVPLGMAILAGAVAWMVRLARGVRRGTDHALLGIVMVTLVHAMLEFPLEYAYMLFPIGFLLGMLEAEHPAPKDVPLPRWLAGVAVACGMAWTVWLGHQYLAVEADYRAMRMQSARIGSAQVDPNTPDFFPLTQLQAFIAFARAEATREVAPGRLKWMRQIAERYGYPPVLFRYAIAAGLSGDGAGASLALIRLCKQSPPANCSEAKENWALLQRDRFPELRHVDFPH